MLLQRKDVVYPDKSDHSIKYTITSSLMQFKILSCVINLFISFFTMCKNLYNNISNIYIMPKLSEYMNVLSCFLQKNTSLNQNTILEL